MAKKKLTDWGSLSGDLEKDRKKEKQKPKTQTTQIGTGINNDWNQLTGNSKEDRSNIAKRQEEYKKSAAAYQAQMDSINRTSKRSRVMMQGFHSDPVRQAQSEMDYHARELARNAPLYQQISKEARKFSDYGTLNAAQSGLRQSSGNFADSYERYQQASQKAREDYLANLKQTNKSQYYGETLSREQIEGHLRQLEQKKTESARAAELATEAAKNDPHRAEVYSSQSGDGREPWYTRALWNSSARNDELDAEIARYQAALKYRNSLDKDAEMEELARSISSLPNFREMSEVGRAMVEGRNKSARASVNSMDYQPDDPDNNLHFARAEQREREALGKSGYVSDLDSSYIPEEVKPIYYALFVQSPQKAQEFAAYWADKGEQARWNALYEKSGEDAGERFKAFIEGTFANTASGLDPFGEGGQYAAKLGKTMIGGGAAGLTEKGLFNTGFGAGSYHSDLFGDISLGSAYQLGSSMLQSAANATLAKMTGGAAGLVGGAGTILLGSSAAASDYQEKIEQGWDENSARWHALAAGAAESIFEYVSLDKLVNEDITKGFLRNFLTQGGVEASEEAFTTIANRITDGVISELSGNESQIQAKVRELMEHGYEKGTAEKMAQQEWMTELMSDALGGFVSGGIMSSGQYAMYPVYKAMGAVETRRQNERTGALSSRTGEAAALAQYAADNDLGWTAPEQSAEAVNQSKSSTGETDSSASRADVGIRPYGAQNDVSQSTLGQQVAEAGEQQKTRKELRQERKESRQIGADVNRVRSHIQEQFSGKTVQEQQAIRDELVKKYGSGMELPVYRAISMETAKQAAKLDSTDAIRKAREAVLAEIQDDDMKRAVAEGYDQAAYQMAAQSNDLNAAAKYIQQVRNTGSGGMSMTATVTGEDGQSRQVKIADMTEDGKGVKLEDGTVVAAKDLVADADTMDVVKQLARLNLGRDASAVLQAYRDSGVAESEGYRWIMDYATAYEQGRTARISLKQAVERSSLDAKTVMDAYQKGQQYAQAETEKAEERKNKARKKGVTGRKSNIDTSELTRKGITYEKMTDAERRQYDLANKIFELIGVDLKWIASDIKTDSRGQEYYSGVNGSYLNGVVTLDIHAGQNYVEALRSGVLATTGHELTHFLEQYAPKQYKALKEFVFRQIVENSANGEQTLERMIWEKQKRSKFRISAREAEHEVVADACQKMLLDSEAIREFAAENEEAAKGMVRWLRDFFAKIKAAFRQSTELTEQARFMAGLEKDVRKAFGKLWDEALREAVKAHDEIGAMESESGEQNSDRDYNHTVMLEERTIDKYLADYAAKSSPNYAQAYIVQMRPDDFLNLTTSKAGRDRIYRETGELDVEKLKDASIHQPFQLRIDSKTGQVEGHEGRHRAMALSRNGIRSIPVLLFDSSNKYNKTAMEELVLTGQDFGSSRSNATVTVQDVQPLSYANRDNIIQKYTTQPSTERMGEKYGGKETIRYSEREDQRLRDRVSDLEEQLEFADLNELSQTEIRRLNNELIKARGRLDAYTANQRRQVKRTSYNEILRNLENYERVDLESLAEQISDSAWDDYDELSDEDLIDALRETINERLDDFGPGEADDPKYGLWVKKPKAGDISMVRAAQNTNENNNRFSMRDPVETTDRLIALHNLNAVKLNKALDLGGFPMPSIAVTKTSIPHTNFGPITLVMDKSTIDPQKDRRNTVYSADAWTPTFPSVEYEADEKAESRLRRKYYDLEKKFGRDAADPLYPWGNYAEDELNRRGGPEEVIDRYHDDTDMMKLFLLDSGLSVPENVKEVQVKRMDEETIKFYDLFVNEMGKDVFEELKPREGETIPETRKRWWAEHGEEFESVYRKYMKNLNFSDEEISNVLENESISSQTRKALQMRNYIRTGPETRNETVNVAATNAAIRAAVDAEQYDAWLHGLFDGLVKSRGIYNGKDRYTPSGNSRSFAATHYSVTLENIAKAMAAQNDGNSRNVSGFYGVKSLRAGLAKRFSSIAEMHKYEGRLQHLTEEQAEKINEALADRLGDVMGKIYDTKPHGKYDNRFIDMDAIGENLMEITEQKNITGASIQRIFSKYGYKIDNALAEDIRTLLFDVSQMPVNIYEAKPERAVRFDEVMAAVVPSNTDKSLIEKLRAAGVQNVIEYRDGDDADRLEKVNSVEDAKFSERDYDQISDLELMDNAAESLSEAGGEEYWNALLESAPELADDKAEIQSMAKAYREQAKKLAEAEKRLAEAKRNLTLTDRKLRTRGISGMVQEIMKSLEAGDAKNQNVAKNVTEIIVRAYQKGLDAIDAGKNAGEVWDVVWNEGVEKAADYLLANATHSEKFSYKWTTTTLGKYMPGEDGRFEVLDAISSKVVQDWSQNRVRDPIQETAADRIVQRVEGRMQKQIDEQTERADTAEGKVNRLQEDVNIWKDAQLKASDAASRLQERLDEVKAELKQATGDTAKEKRAKREQAVRLNNRLIAKRQEAAAWKTLASRNEALLRAALKSKNEDIDALRIQMDKNATEAQKKQAALVKKLTEQVEREKRILEGKLKPPAMQRLLKAERERAAKEAEQHKDEVFRNYKERQRHGNLRQRIRNLSDEMKRRMTNPSERAYVPASLYESMTKLADLLDDVLSPKPGTKAAAKYRAMMDAIHGLAREYSAVKDMDDPTYSSEYDQEIQDAISEIERVLERKDASWLDELTGDTKKGLRELSTGELQRIYELMRSINYSMVGATAMLGHSGFKNVFDAMRSVAEQQQTITPLNEAGKAETAKRSRLIHKLSTMRAVEMMSGWQRDAALYQLMHDIEQGVADSNGWVMNYGKSMQALKTGKNELEYRRAISKKLDDYNVKDARGNKVLMTKMQALQILMTAEREAHNDTLVHLQKGGAVIRDRNAGTSYTIKVTPELIQKIQDSLTEWDWAYMKAIRSYLQMEGKRTNEILYKLKHKVLQTEEYYFPYNVDKNYLETKLDSPEAAMSMWVKTPRPINPLAQNASQPVYIDGMDSVMEQHVREIANYIGIAIPIRDFSKVYNGMLKQGDGVNPLPVKETIHNNYGDDGQRLLTQAIIDVQGGRKPNEHRTQLGKLLDKLQSAFYRKSLLINAGVTLKQAASYIAAESILSHKALERGNHPAWTKEDASNAFGVGGLIRHLFLTPSGKTAQRLFNEIDEHTSIHYQRRQGMSMQELAQEANRSGRIKTRLGLIGAGMEQYKGGHTARMIVESVDPLNWIQRMDVATTAALWVACKEQAKLDGMKSGTQEYWDHVTELYERCIRETQPMYDTLHRSEDQKDRSGLMQYLFPFRTVPIQNHGQLAASFEAFKAAQKSGDEARIKQAGTFFRKTAIAQTLSAAVFAAFTLFAAVSKRKTKKYRDEDEELTLESLGFGVGRDLFGTLFSVFFPMFGSAAWDTINTGIDYARSGKEAFSYDAFSIGVADMLNNLWQTGGDLGKDVIDLIAGRELNSDDVVKHIGKMVVSGLECAGFPTTTATSYWNGIKGNFDDLKEGRLPALNDESWERKIGVNAQRLVKAAVAGDTQKVEAVLEEMRGNILEEKPNLKEDKVNGRIQNAVTSYVKGLYMDGKLSEAKATELMVQYGSSDDEHEAYWKIREWEAKVAHADDDEYSFNKYEDLRAILAENGDISSEVKRLTDHGVKADSVNKDVKATIKDLFNDGTITESEAIAMLQKYHQTKDDKTKQYRADTADEAWFIVDEWKEGAESDEEDFNYTKYSDLREAIRTGGNVKDEIDLLTGHGVTEKAVYEDVNKTINTMLSDGAINGDKAEDLLLKYGKVKDSETKAYRAITEDEAWAKVREWQGNIEHAEEEDYNYSKYDEIDAAISANKDIKAIVKDMTDHGVEEKNISSHVKGYLVDRYVAGGVTETALKNQLSRYLGIVAKDDVDKILNDANSKKQYGVNYSSLDEEYRAGNIKASEMKTALMKYGGLSAADADKKIRWYDLQKQNPDLEISESKANTWYDGTSYTKSNGHESAKAAGMSIQDYLRAKDELAKVKGVDANNDGRTDTGSREIAYIRTLTAMSWLTDRQRRALYYEEYKGTSKTSKRPW